MSSITLGPNSNRPGELHSVAEMGNRSRDSARNVLVILRTRRPFLQIIVSEAEAPWASNVTLRVVGTTPANLSQSPPLNVLFLVEINANTSGTLQRLAKLLPGLAAEVRLRGGRPGDGVSHTTEGTTARMVVSPYTNENDGFNERNT